ncbi:MAG: hypothetical protein ACTSWQ_03995 [Candidatus Thorarchaeota archaeon]
MTTPTGIQEDIIGLTGYILETELRDMIEVLEVEPLYVEEEIITQEEANELDPRDEERMMEIVNKACDNPLNLHIYALAHRIRKEFEK